MAGFARTVWRTTEKTTNGKHLHVRQDTHGYVNTVSIFHQEQDKSSDIEQQPPFGDRKISNIQPQNRGGGGSKPTGTSYNFDKV